MPTMHSIRTEFDRVFLEVQRDNLVLQRLQEEPNINPRRIVEQQGYIEAKNEYLQFLSRQLTAYMNRPPHRLDEEMIQMDDFDLNEHRRRVDVAHPGSRLIEESSNLRSCEPDDRVSKIRMKSLSDRPIR